MHYALKYSITFILALCLTLLLGQTATTQTDIPSPNLHQWGAVTLFHGLPSDHVRAISQDADGIMLFGTDAGLVRYDGRRVKRISAEGPASSRIRAIKLDTDGALWIGTDAGAARILDDDIKLIPETENKSVTAIITVGKGRAIFTTEQGAIFDCSIASDGSFNVRAINYEDHPTLRIESLNRPLPLTSIITNGDSLILGSRSRGLIFIQGDKIDEMPLRPRPFFIETITRDKEGRFFIGAQTSVNDSGLYESLDLRRATKIGEGLGTVTSIAFDEQNEMWVGTDKNGAFHFRGERVIERFTFNSTAGGLRSNHIYSTFVDREGVIWFGTDRGACRYDPRSLRAEIVSVEPESNFVRALFQSADGRLWCGANRGLFIREETAWRQVDELRGKTVHAISQSGGRLIAGTASGLFTSDDGAQFSRSAEGEIIRAVCQFQGATYIANFNRGLERLNASERALILSNRQIISLQPDKNQMWIGTANAGAMVFDGKQATTLPALETLRDAAVRSIAVSEDETVWLATSRGLYALRSNNLTPVIEDVDARQVIVAENQAWCATEAGLYTALIDRDAGVIISRMSAEQGLPSQNVFTLLTESNTLWIGTNRGVARYTRGSVAPVIKAERVLGKRAYSLQEIAAGLRLEYPQNSLSVEVAAASSRTFSEQFQYRFSLIDPAGQEVKLKLAREPAVSVENLRPGRYKIIARAITGDLVSSDPLSIAFEVERAPFPLTTAALSLLLALALAGIAWGYYQNKRLTRTNEALEGANLQLAETRMQMASETEAERRRIARDLHDQTLADLRRLLLLTDEMPRKDESGENLIDPLILRREIETISTEIRRTCEDLSPSALENVGLAAALEYALSDAVAHLPLEQRFEYEFSCREGIEERLRLSPVVQIQIYRIFQEAISNISRHAAAKRVRLSVEERDESFLLTLEDDGCGFDPRSKRARTGRGIANIISRASLIEAQAEWTEPEGGGTRFTLRKGIYRLDAD